MTILPPSLCILFVILNTGICSDDKDHKDYVPRVVNGRPGKLGDVPYQLAFKMISSRAQNMYSTFCGGTIIGPSKVLSAAHCFEEKANVLSKCITGGKVSKGRLSKIMAVAGNLYNVAKFEADSLQNGQWRQLSAMAYPRNYKFPKADIAVGRTRTPFVFNAHVGSIPCTSKYVDYKGPCLASGFGRITSVASSAPQQRSEILLLAELDIVPAARCSQIFRKSMYHFVCTDIMKTDISKGDSGGPLVCSNTGDPKEGPKGILVGIVSGASPRVGSFFTRVSSYPKFIASRGTAFNTNSILNYLYLIYGIRLLFLFCFI